ncbi:hypothetical protein DFH09DRAFT_925301, partial [Mycena vulgaris]
IEKFGPSRFCAVASDNASPLRKGRHLTVTKFLQIFDFADACHNLHNACKDICNIPVFQQIIAELEEILAFMSLSSYSRDWFDETRKSLGISRGLQSVGETRFATIYRSLDSVLRGIPEFSSIVRNRTLGDVYKFRRDLTRLVSVLMPFAWAIQCLESKDITPADVYLYWLAIFAQLNDLISKDDDAGNKSKYATTVKELIRSIANFQFLQLIEEEHPSKA